MPLEAVVTVDNAKRAELYRQVLDILNDEVPWIILFTINRVSARKENIVWSETPTFHLDFRPGKLVIS